MPRTSPWKRIAFLLCFWLVTTQVARAQSSLHGTVVDPTGASISGVAIELHAVDGTLRTQSASSKGGDFSLLNLAPGSYRIVVPATKGFASQEIPIHVGTSNPPLQIKLALEAVTQTIEVGAQEPLSTSADANKDAVAVTGASLSRLPVFDQNFVGALVPFLDPASSASDGITILVDGVQVKASTVSPSAIAEVRINNDPYSAEFSRPGRARINIITKPGSPVFHGELNFIARDATFNGRNYFAPVRPPEQRRLYEGHLTGPAGRGGHTTFLLSGSRREDDGAVAVHAFGVNGLIASNVLRPIRENQISATVTKDLSDAHRLSAGYNFEYSTRRNSGVGGIVLAEAGYDNFSREDDLIFNDRIIINPRIFNQLQVTLEKDGDVTRSVSVGPSLLVQDSFTGGGAQADVDRTENTIHINEVVSLTYKNHYIRFGANIPQMSRRAVDDHTNRQGTFGFNSLSNFTSATPYVFTVQQGPGRGLYWINEIGGFVQDEIKLRKNLTLTAGLRYQWQTYLSSTNTFAPRASAAYSPAPKLVLRVGAGLFYDRTGGDFPGTFKLHNGIVLRSAQLLNPSYPNALAPGQDLSSVPTSLVRESAQLRTPYSIQYSFVVERQLLAGLTVTAGYRGITGVSSFRSRDANAPLGPLYASRPDPSLGFVQQIEAGGRLRSNALDVSLKGKAGRWFEGQAQYTLGRVRNNTSGIGFYPQDQYNPNAEYARADYDRLNRFNLLGNINPEHWLTLGVAATLYSGAPYTETAGLDVYRTGLSNARPAGVGRNTLQGGGTADLDLLWDHDIKLNKAKADKAKTLNVGVSGFNVLNHTNYTSYIGSVRSPLFGQPTAALPGRQLQFGMRYQF